MANRGPIFDPTVFSIQDLEEQGSKKLARLYRGKRRQQISVLYITNSEAGLTFKSEYYNEGAMDLITSVSILSDSLRTMYEHGLRRRSRHQAQRQCCSLQPLQDLAADLTKRFSCEYHWQVYGTDSTIRGHSRLSCIQC